MPKVSAIWGAIVQHGNIIVFISLIDEIMGIYFSAFCDERGNISVFVSQDLGPNTGSQRCNANNLRCYSRVDRSVHSDRLSLYLILYLARVLQ